ncbi:Oidioi.mRNA.OKI2018_I69.PAR.g12567.t1.cds [Oikopleura dioica]|uniref:Oidioi.mRNA.OKI2018_I69.PAR.g12567.t1.cds n=1 Tax=Oikopleura dioica TaxID=34765 RepID=A0ABN7S8A0_OIKDI|nr:Oidioi.mRNA.OKI2018_I69.PAR.g12567.t1.cds [Oikopleura dioica]
MSNIPKVAAHIRGIAFPKRAPWTPKIPDWPVIPENIKQIAAAAAKASQAAQPLIAPRDPSIWAVVGEPDRIEVVRAGIQYMKRKPISEEEAEAILY